MVTYVHEDTVFVDQGRIEFTLKEIGVTIICPNVKRTTGKGAGYVKDWKILSSDLMRILVTWYEDDRLKERSMQKKHLRQHLGTRGVFINEDPMNARVSELLGLGLVSMTKKMGKPHYNLVVNAVSTVLDNNGRL